MQPRFRKAEVFWLALLVAAIVAGKWLIRHYPDRQELGPRAAEVRFEPLALDPAGFAPLRLAGAWLVTADDPRFGGISALAIERGKFLALTDSGVAVLLPKPGQGSRALLRELPGGPGGRGFKSNRDSEALLRDPSGRGWWVAFENRDSLWLYDHAFADGRQIADLSSRRWRVNKGVEALALDGGRLLLLVESGDEILSFGGTAMRVLPLPDNPRRVSDAAVLADGRIFVLQRRSTAWGLKNWLARLEPDSSGYRLAGAIPLGVGPLDVLEGLAIEDGPTGVRLWIISDDNFRGSQRTLLLALDLPAAAAR